MNALHVHIRLLKSLLKTLKDEVDSLGFSLDDRLKTRWEPRSQTATIDWRPREETPPPGTIWATDGESVWLIEKDGRPISSSASAVKMWAPFAIPRAPRLASRAPEDER